MSQSGPGRREVAYRLFAAEFDDAEYSYSESDEERAPNYVVTPTGARVNRLFAVGVLTEIEDVNPEMVRGRVVDPTGAFVTYAGQYQPDALAFLERIDPPTFLALSGKARTFEPEDGDRIYTSVRPESVSEVDAETRDRWIVTAAERTVERIGIVASAIESGLTGGELEAALSEAGVDDRLAEGVVLALEYYGTTPAYLEALRELSIDAVRVVAGEREEADRLELAPGEGEGDASALSTLDLSDSVGTSGAVASPEGASEPAGGEAISGSKADADPEIGEPAATADAAGVDEGDEDATDVDPASSVASEPAAETTTADADEPPEEPAVPDGTTSESEPTGSEEPTAEEELASVEEDLEDFDPGEFELDEAERREVEEEFGTEFSTAGEVKPADAGSETAVETGSEPGEGTSETGTDAEPETTTARAEPEPEPEPEPEAQTTEPEPTKDSSEGDEDVDLTDAVMDAMERLDEGDGADREALVTTVADEQGVDADAVEEAIQDALMSGRCYEPADGTLKSI